MKSALAIFFFKEPRLLRPARPTERIFTPDSVTRVDIVDSYWNGALIGAAIGSILAFGIYRWEDSERADSNLKGIYTLGFGTASILFSIGSSGLVDGLSNRPIYERPSPASRVTVAPLIGRGQRGLVARVSF